MAIEPVFADTNLFLRLLTDDVPEQAEAFANLLQKAAQGEMQFVTNPMVLAEIIWTLESYYELSKEAIQEKVLAILNTPGLKVIDEALILKAILWYVDNNVDFIDAYHAAWMLEHGIVTACTFDQRHFARFDGISTVIPM